MASRLITLPNHAALSDQEIDAVAEIFLASLRACRTGRPHYPAVSLGSRSVPLRDFDTQGHHSRRDIRVSTGALSA